MNIEILETHRTTEIRKKKEPKTHKSQSEKWSNQLDWPRSLSASASTPE